MKDGFSLVEVLIAMVVGAVALGAVYGVYATQLRGYRHHQVLLDLQQQLRGASVVMAQQVRMAGFDPEGSGAFGVTDVRRYSVKGTGPDPEGQPALFYNFDLDEDGVPDPRNGFRNREHCNFRVRRIAGEGRWVLAWDNGMGRHPVAERIRMLGLAYAVDADGDGVLDRWRGGPHLTWAVDTTNDNFLDTHLDVNNDGVIDRRDFPEGADRIDGAAGTAIEPPIPVDRIRAVRIWLLAESAAPVKGHVDLGVHVVGDRLVRGTGDGHLRRVVEKTVVCRNWQR
ncbi:PilW family protein [Desulfatitalea alkaliphila]|uniref:Prepilin-type N-terminal cleavage/methylation domain-containing protein n=1 Tax=Desulfatitalea alkaliphila TaxID=2929485 RepID=A0AA41UK47_9BACT|nr:prepilin-type N-terminal cleavage/methylation domain-containing protein [Desulfatitalea alkaliphila]MCJ8501929.1 prepilin-type N-terminal cleavage/methylation domain-containing protein [Desulfatitalea alkaliphila]